MNSLASVRALIVDDCRQMRYLVRSLLRAVGLTQCKEAPSAAEAMTHLRAHFVDLIITDLAMRGENGVSFATEVRRDGRVQNQFVAIVMLTGHSERHRVAAARDAGVNTFVCKPISARNLIQHIEVALNDGRLFVRAPAYFGPDRRRMADDEYDGPRRRETDFGAAEFDLESEFDAGARAYR